MVIVIAIVMNVIGLIFGILIGRDMVKTKSIGNLMIGQDSDGRAALMLGLDTEVENIVNAKTVQLNVIKLREI